MGIPFLLRLSESSFPRRLNELRGGYEWLCTCHNKGVLRITIPNDSDCPTFVLEGRLTGDWVGELLRATRELLPGTDAVFNIEDVLFVDSLGERALQWLNHLGAKFVVRNSYGVDLCERLRLQRSAKSARATQGKQGKGKSEEL